MYIMILSQIKLEWQNENGKQYDKKQNQNEYRMLDVKIMALPVMEF